jgi:hypothetical protein
MMGVELMKASKIVLELDEKSFEFTIEEAREVYNMLNGIFGEVETTVTEELPLDYPLRDFHYEAPQNVPYSNTEPVKGVLVED